MRTKLSCWIMDFVYTSECASSLNSSFFLSSYFFKSPIHGIGLNLVANANLIDVQGKFTHTLNDLEDNICMSLCTAANYLMQTVVHLAQSGIPGRCSLSSFLIFVHQYNKSPIKEPQLGKINWMNEFMSIVKGETKSLHYAQVCVYPKVIIWLMLLAEAWAKG